MNSTVEPSTPTVHAGHYRRYAGKTPGNQPNTAGDITGDGLWILAPVLVGWGVLLALLAVR